MFNASKFVRYFYCNRVILSEQTCIQHYLYFQSLFCRSRMCSAAKHVPEIAKGFHVSKECKELPARMSEIKKCLKNARQSLEDNNKAVEKSGDDCLQQIHTLRQQFNAIFDRLEQRTVAEIEEGNLSLGIKIQAEIDKIDDVTERLQKLSDDWNDGGENNEATSYIGSAKCDDVIWKASVLLQDISKADEYKLSFQPNKVITEILSSLEMLGEVICDGGEKPLPSSDHVFEVEKHAVYNVKVAEDTSICNISGMCCLSTGEFLLSDNYNMKIKLLNNNCKVISSCGVLEYPHDVCLIGERDAAVAVNESSKNRHEIHFFQVRSGMLLKTKSIKLQHECIALTHHSGDIYITTKTALHVYNISSGQDRKLYSDETGGNTVYRCAVSPDGSRIYITNYSHHQLITVSKDGTKLFTLTHPELRDPVGVHVTSPSHMFVSCHKLNTVVQVMVMKDQSQTVKPLVGMKERLTKPRAVCSSTDTLVVGQFENDNIVKIQLKY